MAIKRLGAQRFSGLDADVPSLPIDADLVGAIFSSTDTLKFWIFNGTTWNESTGGGGITGLNPNSTILDHSTTLTDYTSPSSATATSEDGANVAANAVDENTGTFWKSDAGINESITVDLGNSQNSYGLAYYLSTAAGMTETQFQIISTSGGVVFSENYDSDVGWTTVGTSISVDSAVANHVAWTNTNSSSLDQRSKALGLTLPTDWVAEFEFTETGLGSCCDNFWVFCIMAGTDHFATATQDGVSIGINQNTRELALASNDGGSFSVSAAGIVPVLSTTYFYRLTKTSTNIRLEVFTDSNRTTPFGSAFDKAIPATITGLNTLGHSSAGNAFSVVLVGANLDNTTISVSSGLDEKVLRTIKTIDLTLDAYNFIRFNGATSNLIKIEGSSGSSLVMAANDLQVLVETDPPLITLHGQFEINGTNDTLALNGGDPVSSVIEDPQVNSLTLNNVGTQSDPISGASVMWQETQDANNDTTRIKMKINGSIEEVRFF